VNQTPNLFRRLARKGRLSAPFAYLRRNAFYQDVPVFDRENLADETVFRDCAAADTALKHGYLRLL